MAGDADTTDSVNAVFRLPLAIALGLAGLGLVAATLFQVRFVLAPLQAIEKRLTDIRSGAAEKLEGELPAEIEPLKTELNALIRSNQDIVERARTQVGNLAHALKTPLAVILNEARDEKAPVRAPRSPSRRRSCTTRSTTISTAPAWRRARGLVGPADGGERAWPRRSCARSSASIASATSI